MEIVDSLNSQQIKPNILFTESELPNSEVHHLKVTNGYVPIATIEMITGHISSEISSLVHNKISYSILDNGPKSFLDLRGLQYPMRHRKFQSELDTRDQEILISNGRISSDISDLPGFSISLPMINSFFYLAGRLCARDPKKNIWVNPFLKWTDNFILMSSDIEVNISNIFNKYVHWTGDIIPRIETSFDLKFEVKDSEVLFLFEDDYMSNYNYYVNSIRNSKLDIIEGYEND
jgi:hypothetical protein